MCKHFILFYRTISGVKCFRFSAKNFKEARSRADSFIIDFAKRTRKIPFSELYLQINYKNPPYEKCI